MQGKSGGCCGCCCCCCWRSDVRDSEFVLRGRSEFSRTSRLEDPGPEDPLKNPRSGVDSAAAAAVVAVAEPEAD